MRQLSELETTYVLYEYVGYLLFGKAELSRGVLEKIKQGIENLNDLHYIKILSTYKRGVEVDLSPLYFETQADADNFSAFTLITKSETQAIMNSGVKYPFKLLRYFVSMIGTISNGTDIENNAYHKNVGCTSISKIAGCAKISESAAMDYNRILEELELIVIARSNEAVTDGTGQIITGFSNCYGRPAYAETVCAFQAARERSKGTLGIKNLGASANVKRSNAQLYNSIVGGKSYDDAVVRYVYNFYRKENSNYDLSLNKIAKQYNEGKISYSQMELQIDEYKSYHHKRDLAPLLSILNGVTDDPTTGISDEGSIPTEAIREDSLEDCNAISDEMVVGLLEPQKAASLPVVKNDSIELLTIPYKVNHGLVRHFANLIKRGGLSLISAEYDLKRNHNCSEEILAEYMREIERELSNNSMSATPVEKSRIPKFFSANEISN